MLEIVLLIAAASGIATYARGPLGNAYVWGGGLGVGGYVLIQSSGPIMLASLGRPLDPDSIWLFAVALAWLDVVAFSRRVFSRGQSREAVRHVVLPQLQDLNQRCAVACEACKQPYTKPNRIA